MATKRWLKMEDGAEVKTLEELREHFDVASALGYYIDGSLLQWLKNGYYDKEVKLIEEMSPSSKDLGKRLCEILGTLYLEDEMKQIDFSKVFKKNERREWLRKFAPNRVGYSTYEDDQIPIDQIAFTQEELLTLIDNGINVIYLCDGLFTLSGNVGDITYIGINNPAVRFDGDIIESGIVLQDLVCDLSNYLGNGNSIADVDRFYKCFEKNPELGIQQLKIAAKKGDASAQTVLGICYLDGFAIKEKDDKELDGMAWMECAAELGNVMAQTILGKEYIDHTFYMSATVNHNYEKALKWYEKAAEQGHAEAQIGLGNLAGQDPVGQWRTGLAVAMKWYKKAAEQGHAVAQMILGNCFMGQIRKNDEGEGYCYENRLIRPFGLHMYLAEVYPLKVGYILSPYTTGDHKEALVWYKKAAEQGFADAQLLLGACYMDGLGVEKSAKKGFGWI